MHPPQCFPCGSRSCLNEVRSWRPEQFNGNKGEFTFDLDPVSMKSGLGDRNNIYTMNVEEVSEDVSQ